MLYSFSLFSVPTAILEVLLVIVPALLSVAYVTVAERKTMASMQRRVGPNKVGEKIKLIRLYKSKRFYHNSSILYNNLNIEAVKDLYKNRVALVKEFDCEVVTTCTYILKKKKWSSFPWYEPYQGDKGGIYIFKYKLDPNIYYIGRSKNFKVRLKGHF